MNGQGLSVLLPDWLGAALIGAVLAAAGFVARQVVDWFLELRRRRDERRARLLELASLLRAGKMLFGVQNAQARRLMDALEARFPTECKRLASIDAVLSGLFSQMTAEEQELHSIVRSTTINGMRPLNEALLEWIRKDSTYRTSRAKRGHAFELASALHQLEVHLLIWHSKYAAWIPDHPQHALVYLADEEKHGPPFPRGIDDIVDRALR